MIDTYLRELRQRLPRWAGRRFLVEAEAHLRDAAARHRQAGQAAEQAERRAVEEFGPPEEIAARAARQIAAAARRPAALLVLAAALLYVVPLYGIPENVLPPAPWSSVPDHLAIGRDAAVGLWIGAIAAATTGVVTTRWAASAIALCWLAASALVSAAVAVAWDAEAPATPLAELLLLMTPLAAAAVLAPAAALLSVRRLARR
jgi:hypothetical protein